MYGIRRDGERLEQDYVDKVAEKARLNKKHNKSKNSKKKLENFLKSKNRQFDY